MYDKPSVLKLAKIHHLFIINKPYPLIYPIAFIVKFAVPYNKTNTTREDISINKNNQHHPPKTLGHTINSSKLFSLSINGRWVEASMVPGQHSNQSIHISFNSSINVSHIQTIAIRPGKNRGTVKYDGFIRIQRSIL